MNLREQRRIGFLGGSFDPPHRGHLSVARATADAFNLDTILIAPTGQQPLKPEGATASFEDRLAMVERLCSSDGRLQASALDAPRLDGQPNYTVDTLRRLRPEIDGEVFVIVGADAFLDLRRWRTPEELLELAEWIVVTRPGFSLERLEELGLTDKQRRRVHVLTDVSDPVSATEIRERLRDGRDCVPFVPGGVLAYILERHLYGA